MRNSILRVSPFYGALGALVAAAVQLGIGLGIANQLFVGADTSIRVVAFLLNLAFSFLTGRAASAQTGKAGSGTVAGLLVGLITGFVGNLVAVIFFSPVGREANDLLIQVLVIIASLMLIVLNAALGAGAGALGGLLGRRGQPGVA